MPIGLARIVGRHRSGHPCDGRNPRLLLSPLTAQTTGTWTGAAGNAQWSAAGNWSGGTPRRRSDGRHGDL
ncbi:MAG: hypothetical protein WDM96_08515 [Lacunisphaera sp.]